MKRDKVVVRALHQFMYLNNNNKYDIIDKDREIVVHVRKAIEWVELDLVDVLNPQWNDGIEEYQNGYNLYMKVGNE